MISFSIRRPRAADERKGTRIVLRSVVFAGLALAGLIALAAPEQSSAAGPRRFGRSASRFSSRSSRFGSFSSKYAKSGAVKIGDKVSLNPQPLPPKSRVFSR
jgi:hypothetical protein